MSASIKASASLFFALVSLHLAPASARATVPSRTLAAPEKNNGLTWLLPTSQARREVVSYLKSKAGRDVSLPLVPANDLLSWFFSRHDAHLDNARVDNRNALYALAFEDFLVAQKLLDSRDLTSRRKGLRLALYSSLWIKERLQDFKLREGFFDALLLPNLDAAYGESWKDLSRQSILERACAAYRENGSTTKQIAALKRVVEIADSPNAADWARIKLCEVLDSQQKYGEAIRYLNQVHSPEMSGSKTWIVELQQKLDQQKLEQQKLEQQKREQTGTKKDAK